MAFCTTVRLGDVAEICVPSDRNRC